MKRDLYQKLLNWKASKQRKPLILRGARQVGKTYLLRTFAAQEYSSYVYLNFEEDPKLSQFFTGQLTPKSILENLSIYRNQEIKPETTLLIFDEIQESAEALNSLKYFQEQANEFHVVAAGSLLGIKLTQIKGFPVGKVNFYDLYPLCFFEFLAAIGKTKLRDYLLELKETQPLPEPIHQELTELLKKYMFIGGMPEAVADYVNNTSIINIRKIQQDILDAYVLDFAKHAPANQVMKISAVWESIPSQLAKENKKFIFSAFGKSARGREYEAAIQWLADAGLIHKSYNISTPKLPLEGYSDKHVFKVFLLDVGLLAAMSKIPASAILEGEQLFAGFNGAFTENFMAQELASQHGQIYYWTSEGKAEIDFVLQHNLEVVPLEVKAGTSTHKKSLHAYSEKYQPRIMARASLLNLKKDGKILNIPLYLIKQWETLIDL